MSKPTGGPAFPGLNEEMTGISSDGVERYDVERSGGMTLRDYFAAAALATCAGYSPEDVATWAAKDFAAHAFALADAMLVERAK